MSAAHKEMSFYRQELVLVLTTQKPNAQKHKINPIYDKHTLQNTKTPGLLNLQ